MWYILVWATVATGVEVTVRHMAYCIIGTGFRTLLKPSMGWLACWHNEWYILPS